MNRKKTRQSVWRALAQRYREDVTVALQRDPSLTNAREAVLFSTGLHAIWAFRRQHWLWERGFHTVALFLSHRSRRRWGIDIHPAATIGRRFFIDHGEGIVIGETAVIGDDCLLYQGVTLGMTGHHGGKRHPTLGNNVFVGAGAIILGDIHLGDDSKVGAGAVLLHDVPNGATVTGIPAHVVKIDSRSLSDFLVLPHDHSTIDDENIRWSCAL